MAEEQKLSISVQAYAKAKAKGTTRVVLMDGQHIIRVKQWNPDDGAPVKPIPVPISKEAVEAYRKQIDENYKAEVAGCDALLADIAAAKEV